MTIDSSRSRLSAWIPFAVSLLVSLMGNAVLLGIFYGATQSELRNLRETDIGIKSEMMPMEKRLQVFVSRAEYVPQQKATEKELAEIKQLVRDLGSKLDIIN